MSTESLLNRIESPHQLRRLSEGELRNLARELRERIIKVVSANGGHLASNLGIAELTIALHHAFDFSRDRLLWDVGHQCYAHKLLTGRADAFETLRQTDGLSGFPAPSESEYDLFSTGHAGTAISTAMGLAWADEARGENRKTVAVVGDASIVNGLAFEGLNNAAMLKRQFLVVLNDNSMAIDVTRGGLARTLDRLRLTHTYSDFKHSTEQVLRHLPLGAEISEALRHIKAGLRTTLHGAPVFESLGYAYFGPVDGHDVPELIRILRRIRDVDVPVLLHVHTEKGRGCQYAVEDPCRFHSPSAYTVQNGRAVFADKARPTWTKLFSDALLARAREDERIVAVTAAMPDGAGLAAFRDELPERYLDVGISESHAVAMAGGLAKAGLRPVVAVYSTFMQRAFDQVFQEASLQDLPVVLCMDRAGLVGSDGAVHHGFSDISILRTLPKVRLAAPADAAELDAALDWALGEDAPCAIRYPRDEVDEDLPGDCPPFEPGKGRTVREGDDATLLCYGVMTTPAIKAAEMLKRERGLDVAVINARFAKPLDVSLIARRLRTGKPLVTVEDHAAIGGFGSAVLEMAAQRGLDASRVRILGLPDRYIAHASRREQLTEAGLDPTHIAAAVWDLLREDKGLSARKYV
jgi:1-deoxy-D-xylulose-5-phosphate synthase